jgi:hypothetical protein
VQHAHTFNQRSVIVTQLGEHFMRMHKLCIIIENPPPVMFSFDEAQSP